MPGMRLESGVLQAHGSLIKKGEPFIACDRCEQTAPGPDFTRQPHEGANICRSCGKALDKDFKYCPHCGKRW
jgi:NAD-dependent SIR2 family protein deacetylase